MTLQPPDGGVKRSYHSPRRDAQANETRLAILDAALALFETHGFSGTTMKQVAEQASVSEQTVYNAFGDKVGLLVGVAMHVMTSGDAGEDGQFFAALAAETDPIARIRMAARYSREQWQEGALELDLMLSSPDIKDRRLIDLGERVLQYKLEANRVVCGILFPDGIRRSGVSIDEIAAYAVAVDSAPTITTLLKLGWTMDDYEEWLSRLLALFVDPASLP